MLAENGGAGLLAVIWVTFGLLLPGLVMFGMFKKANQPVWWAFIPILNIYGILKIVGRPGWWLLLFLIPCVGFILWILVAIDLAKSFGHGIGFAVGLWFLSLIFLLILSYGSDEYRGPIAAQGV